MSEKESRMKNINIDILAEIEGVSMVLSALCNQLDNETYDSLTNKSLASAIFAVSMHLDRIRNDLADMAR